MRVATILLCFAMGCSSTKSGPVEPDVDADVEDVEDGAVDTESPDTESPDTAPADTGTTKTDTGKPDTKPPACIPVGSPSTCASYSDCCDSGECMSSAGKPARCCWTRLTKVVCSADAECCDGYCTDGKCCVPPGKTCALNSMCCSNWCGSRITTAVDGSVKLTSGVCCVPADGACSKPEDCCSGSCVSGSCKCLAAGAAVPAYAQAQCCSGAYVTAEAGVGYRCK
ncbi:MAG: hypothetical protein IPJ34_38410 [Myxococcales bacterium]|nr:hypothetical protein [Myxococcales bacterium]